ncbi:MAG: hypothetical protein ACYDCK_05110 [Thermoplasmatota archaeon]
MVRAKKAAAKKSSAKNVASKKGATSKKVGARKKPAAGPSVKKKPARPKPGTAASGATAVDGRPAAKPVRYVFPIEVYEPNKDAIKAPIKELGLKWQYLGSGKGRYWGYGINIFAQFGDTASFSIRTHDDKMRQKLIDAWAKYPNVAAETEKKEAKAAIDSALGEWELAKPTPRSGEPDFFFKKRLAEWEAKDPRKTA